MEINTVALDVASKAGNGALVEDVDGVAVNGEIGIAAFVVDEDGIHRFEVVGGDLGHHLTIHRL